MYFLMHVINDMLNSEWKIKSHKFIYEWSLLFGFFLKKIQISFND